MAVSLLDYSDFVAGCSEKREEFANALLKSFERTGFCRLKRHSFNDQQLTELFEWSKKFFDQPLEVKKEISNDVGPNPMRGYTPFRVEEVGKLSDDDSVRAMKDSKEHFDQGPEHDEDFPNKWPKSTNLRGFEEFMEAFYRQCDKMCLTLMEALEIAWGITDGSLVARCTPSATDLRLTHYPAISVDEMTAGSNTCRIAPHTDFGPITLLFQDSTGGLEIEDRSTRTFAPLPPTDITEMIVNVGDTLTRWTNGRIAGGVHQVTIPESLKSQHEVMIPPRMSMAYLFKAGRDMSVGPLAKFVSKQTPAQFPNITALEFQKWRNSIVYNLDKELYTSEGGTIAKSTPPNLPLPVPVR